ncbi:MAG: hypothetical protein Q8T09_02725 [Candidatus Melainabacteria bacterium]|jgi:hypothetical protein|nr:hypothetical protein [Candidatus Melainabacteria bacterium]
MSHSKLFADLLNGLFERKNSQAIATAINGSVSFQLGDEYFTERVNLKVSLGKVVTYFSISEGVSPFVVSLSKLTNCPDAQTQAEMLYREMEDRTKWQLERMVIDHTKFTFKSVGANTPTSASTSKPKSKSVPQALKRPTRK